MRNRLIAFRPVRSHRREQDRRITTGALWLIGVLTIFAAHAAVQNAAAQTFVSGPIAVDNTGETGVPTVNPAIQSVSIVFETGGEGVYRVMIDTHGPGGIGLPDGVFDTDDDWVWRGGQGFQATPAKKTGENTVTVRTDWDGNGRWNSADPVQDGTYTARVEVAGSRGELESGLGQTQTVQIIIDTEAPTVSLDASAFSPNGDGANDTTTVAFASSEAPAKIVFGLAEGPVQNRPAISLPASLPTSAAFDWDGTDITGAQLPDGTYRLTAEVTDAGGNTGTASKQIVIDTKAPAIVSLIPVDGSLLNGTTSEATVTFATEGGSPLDLDRSTLEILAADGTPRAGTLTRDAASNTLRFRLAAPLRAAADNGAYTVRATAFDEAGNSASATAQFLFDTIPPVITQVRSSGDVDLRSGDRRITLPASETVTVGIDEQGVGVDFAALTARLTGPTGANVPISVANTTSPAALTVSYTGLSDEGVYTLAIDGLRDIAGNAAPGPAATFQFTYDATAPRIVSLAPLDISAGSMERFNRVLDAFVLRVEDALSEIDFAATTIVLNGPDGTPISGALENDGQNTTTLRLDAPLSRSGDADGTYTLSVKAADAAGNAVERAFQFVYDVRPPSVVSTQPASDATISKALSDVRVTLADDASGVDLGGTTATLTGPGGAPIPADVAPVDATTIGLAFTPLKTDGSQDGVYRLEISTRDLAGNAATYVRQFTLLSRGPRVASIEPADGALLNRLSALTVRIADENGRGLDFDATTVQVTGPTGARISGRVTNNNVDTVVFTLLDPLPADGSADGAYTVKVKAVDRQGGVGSASATLNVDTVPPLLTKQEPGDGATFTTGRLTARIELSDEGSGVDFAATTAQLRGPNGETIPLASQNDGKTIWQLDSAELADAGVYTLALTLVDRAGNATVPIESKFTYRRPRPTVSSITPENKAYIDQLDSIVVTLTDASSDSTIEVLGPNGGPIIGATTFEDGTLTFTLETPLISDGRDDGSYTVRVTPVSEFGVAGEVRGFSFLYDTQPPEITSVTTADLTTAPTFVRESLGRVAATLQDATSGIDLDASTIRLVDQAGNEVPGTQGDDTRNALWWQFDTPLTPGGAFDGDYSIEITATDRAGHSVSKAFPFVYDTTPPTLVSSTPAAGETVTSAISQVTVALDDGTGSGVDSSGTQLRLAGPDGNPITMNTRTDGGTIVGSFSPLTRAGTYSLTVTPRDLAGNVAQGAIEVGFTVVLLAPQVAALRIGDESPRSFIRSFSSVQADLTDSSGVGLDYGDQKTTIRVVGPSGAIAGAVVSDGTSMTWTPTIPFASDGTDDGSYSITVTVVDRAGRVGQSLERRIVYDTQSPIVLSTSPIERTAATSYVGQSISLLTATVQDEGQAGLVMADQSVRLLRADGTEVPGTATHDGSQTVRWELANPLPTDGSADGEYRLVVRAIDRAGNETTEEHRIVYDTQAPTVVKTTPAEGQTLLTTTTEITVTVDDRSGSGVDAASSSFEFTGPGGESIPGSVDFDGTSTLTFHIERDLTQVGTHLLRMTLVDRAGNRRTSEITFFHAANTPTVVSTDPVTFPVEDAFAPSGLAEVSAKLQQTNGGGISLSPAYSEIRLLGPNGETVSGTQLSRGVDTLVYVLARPLADDGSDDGTYQIVVTPANRDGKRGASQTFTFTYDARPPKVERSIGSLFPQTGAPGAIAGFSATVSDPEPASGIDWENVDDTWMILEDPQGRALDARVSGDDVNRLSLILTTPLASDGTQDGTYTLTVAPKDRAGNETARSFAFELDTKAPVIDAASLTLNDAPIVLDTNSLTYPTSINTESGVTIRALVSDDGVGADLARSSIVIVSPRGEPISGTLSQNGVDTLSFRSGPLASEGLYRITVTAVGADASGLGIQPESTLGATFLFEKTPPTATVTNNGGSGIFKSEAARIDGTATDPPSGEGGVPASGVQLVEVGGTDPNGNQLPWESATDESTEQQNPWAEWSAEFLPSRSGKYRVSIRVTDRAGNTNIVDVGSIEFETALAFRGPVYVWPNPLSRGRGDVAHFSFASNQADAAQATLRVFDVSGVLLYEQTIPADRSRSANSQTVTWNLRNLAGSSVASGIYVFQITLNDGQSTVRRMGRLLVVK